jgi:uncharacterized membrane protein YsdA (DUF1294 family)
MNDWIKLIIFIISMAIIAFAVNWEIDRRVANYRKWQMEEGLMPPNWPAK